MNTTFIRAFMYLYLTTVHVAHLFIYVSCKSGTRDLLVLMLFIYNVATINKIFLLFLLLLLMSVGDWPEIIVY